MGVTIRLLKRAAVALAVLSMALPLPGCGSSSPSDKGGSGSGAVAQGTAQVPAHGFTPVPLSTTASGTLNVQLGLTQNIVVEGIVTSACTAGGNQAAGCHTLSYTEGTSTDSSKTLTFPGVSPGSYALILGNVGSGSQAVSYTVTLTTS